MAIFEGELRDAGFVEVAEAFGGHAIVLGATAAKTFVPSVFRFG